MSDGALGNTCALPLSGYDRIVLGHGSGGRLSADLFRDVFLPAFDNDVLAAGEDQASLLMPGTRLAFTTDSFVVHPLFFPGGDIGKLAVYGTINDLAVGGATPRYLSAAFILEEGLEISDLKRIVASMREACAVDGVHIVCGDTKVVERGKGDGVFITTSGIGVLPADRSLSVAQARPGDRVIVSGTLGDHGMAVMSQRAGLEFESALVSDSASLVGLCDAALSAGLVRCMRDPTRGGLASALNEIARAAEVGIVLDEAALRVRAEVRGACEMFGLDPLYVANEGKLVVVAAPEAAEPILAAMRAHPLGRDATIAGTVVDAHPHLVILRSRIGGERVVSMLSGEQLPRIC